MQYSVDFDKRAVSGGRVVLLLPHHRVNTNIWFRHQIQSRAAGDETTRASKDRLALRRTGLDRLLLSALITGCKY